MGLKFKAGDQVKVVAPVISGPVIDQKIIDGKVQVCIAYEGTDGELHHRYFDEDELEAVPAAPEAPVEA